MKKIKILYLIDTLEVGGAEKSTLDICRHLQNCEPIVCSLFSGDALLKDYVQAGIKTIQLNIPTQSYLLPAIRAVKNIIAQENPDVIHAALARAELVGRLAVMGNKIPLVGSLVGDTYNKERYKELGFISAVKLHAIRIADKITASRVNLFISISEFLKQSFIEKLGISATKIKVIPRGRHIGNNLTSTKTREPFLLLNVGRLITLKGQAEIIKAVALVKEHYPQIRLKIAGEGPARSNLEQVIKETGTGKNVELLGRVSNVPYLLSEAQFFIFGSYYEGQGGAIVEAMCANIPIIASDIDVVKEALIDHRSAILYQVKNHKDLAEKIIWALEHPEDMSRFSDVAYADAKLKYNIIDIVRRHEELYSSLIK